MPNSALSAPWTEARVIVPRLQGVIRRWLDKQISSADVPRELAAIQPDIDAMLADAEASLESTYGLPASELQAQRGDALEEMSSSLCEQSSPIGEASAPPTQRGTRRDDPITLGTDLRFETSAVTVTDVLRGDEAAQQIQAANQFNEPTREGHEYVEWSQF